MSKIKMPFSLYKENETFQTVIRYMFYVALIPDDSAYKIKKYKGKGCMMYLLTCILSSGKSVFNDNISRA